MPLIDLQSIEKTYFRGKLSVPVLKGGSLAIERGEMVALMGASGSGKTTLINLLGALDRPTAGRYQLDGMDVGAMGVEERARLRSRRIGFVFQNFNLLPRLSALENVLMPRAYVAGAFADDGRGRARELLARVGLEDRLDHEPARLSGGEQQRVAIARSLINRGDLLIADEPTGNLDSRTGEEILALFRQLNREDGLTILLVTHDPTVAAHADRIIRMADGLIVEDQPSPGRVQREPANPLPASSRAPARGVLRDLPQAMTTALRSLRRNPLRSALTTLGIIIGVASLIAIAEVGKGSWAEIRRILTKMGVENVLVKAGAASRNGVSLGSGSVKSLTPEDAEAIARECPSAQALAPIVNGRGQVVRGGKNWVPANMMGTTPQFLVVRDWEEMADGDAFTESDVRDGGLVCLIGHTLARELFEDGPAINQEVTVNGVPLRVAGVLRRKGADIIGEDQDDILLLPWTTMKYRVSAPAGGAGGLRSAGVADATEQINLLRRRYPRSDASPVPGGVGGPGGRLAPPGEACERRRHPGQDDLDRGDRLGHGADQGPPPRAPSHRGRAATTTSPCRTSPRSSRPSTPPSAWSPACWSAWR